MKCLRKCISLVKAIENDFDMEGWIKIHRGITSHWIWNDPLKLKWWLDILITVNHTPAKVNIGMQLYECGRGQSIMSLSNWADRWKVSKDKARNFLVLLEKDGMITHESLGKTTRITVCNYDSYQGDLHDSQTIIQRSNNDSQTITHTNKNDKNNKNDNNDKNTPKKAGFRNNSNCDLSFVQQDFLEVFQCWLEYKKERRESYKTEASLQACYKKILKLSGGNVEKAHKIIENSMANNWAGLFELKDSPGRSNNFESQKDNFSNKSDGYRDTL